MRIYKPLHPPTAATFSGNMCKFSIHLPLHTTIMNALKRQAVSHGQLTTHIYSFFLSLINKNKNVLSIKIQKIMKLFLIFFLMMKSYWKISFLNYFMTYSEIMRPTVYLVYSTKRKKYTNLFFYC